MVQNALLVTKYLHSCIRIPDMKTQSVNFCFSLKQKEKKLKKSEKSKEKKSEKKDKGPKIGSVDAFENPVYSVSATLLKSFPKFTKITVNSCQTVKRKKKEEKS